MFYLPKAILKNNFLVVKKGWKEATGIEKARPHRPIVILVEIEPELFYALT